MIRYKAVTKERFSSQIKGGKLRLRYIKGEVVKAKKYTAGIMCFKTLRDAVDFNFGETSDIIQVKPIGKGIKPFGFSSLDVSEVINEKDFLHFLSIRHCNISEGFPTGTICYPAVEVLT